jgi:hypothetical protein
MDVQGFAFDPPMGFRTEEMTVGLRMGDGNTPAPSLIVQSKPARAGATLETIGAEVLAELAQTVGKMKVPSLTEFTFADGGAGLVISYNFSTHTGELRQYYALRLHAGRLCTVALTLPSSALTESNARTFMQAIASVRPQGAQ